MLLTRCGLSQGCGAYRLSLPYACGNLDRLNFYGRMRFPFRLFLPRRFIPFHGERHPRERGASKAAVLLAHLAVERNVRASTRGTPGQGRLILLFASRCRASICLGLTAWHVQCGPGICRWCRRQWRCVICPCTWRARRAGRGVRPPLRSLTVAAQPAAMAACCPVRILLPLR